MTNTRTLLAALEAYQVVVRRHTDLVHAEFTRLDERWKRLRQHFHGDSADEFEPYWHRTAQMFQQYDSRVRAITAVLTERIKALHEVNQKTGQLG